MTTVLSLKLCLGLLFLPNMTIDFFQIGIQNPSQKGAARDSPVALSKRSVLAMSFVENTGPGSIELFKGCVVDVFNEGIDNMVEMDKARISTVTIVMPCDADVVNNCRSDRV